MENKRPEFAIKEHSVLSIATEMHNHFRDSQSYYKIAKGNLISELDSMADESKAAEIHDQLREIEDQITFFHVLNNAISTVDTVLHTDKMIAEFKNKQ